MANDLDTYLVSAEALRQTDCTVGHLLKPGDTFDGMRTIAFLGKGASSEVWRMRDESLHADCALKMFAATDSPSSKERFLAEARILAQFSHPNIVHIRRLCETGEHPYFTMDILHPLPVNPSNKAAAKILDGVLDALDALHGKGILHRDLKPSNVLLDDSGNAVLTDLGAAHVCNAELAEKVLPANAHNLTLEGGRAAAIGTPGFGAPEQFLGGEVSPASDIHALGVFIHSLFSGEIPFFWRGIVRRMTSAVPSLRYKSIAEVRKALSKVQMFTKPMCLAVLIAVVTVVIVCIRSLYPHDRLEACEQNVPSPGNSNTLLSLQDRKDVSAWKEVTLSDFEVKRLWGRMPPYTGIAMTNSVHTLTLQDGLYYIMKDEAAEDARYFHELYDPQSGKYSRIEHFVFKGSGTFRWPKVKACHIRICNGVTFITSGKCKTDFVAKTETPPPDARTDDGDIPNVRYAAYTVEKGGKLIFEDGLEYPEGLIERE